MASDPTLRRLDDLCARAPTSEVRFLRSEFLSGEAGAGEPFEEDSPLGLLQRAKYLVDLGRSGEARSLLVGDIGPVPAGLTGVWQQFQTSLEAIDGQGGGGDVRHPEGDMQGLGAEGFSDGDTAPSLGLGAWLTRVQAWRSTLGV